MPLYRLPAEDWPRALGWLVPGENCTDLQYKICQRAWCDLGILEVPNASNRGTRIDRYTLRAGLKPPQYWCAILVGAVFADCGVPVPEEYPSTDMWLPFMREGGAKAAFEVGDAVLYGTKKDAKHIGIVVRVPELQLRQKYTLTVEGNRGFAGTDTNDGLGVGLGPITRKDILGYVSPAALLAQLG